MILTRSATIDTVSMIKTPLMMFITMMSLGVMISFLELSATDLKFSLDPPMMPSLFTLSRTR